MIFDQMKNAACYKGILPAVITALEKMTAYSPDNYPGGKVEIDGDKLFLLLNTYQTRDPAAAQLEAHEKYIDVMYMVEGEELIYVKPTDALQEITQAYDPAIDALLAKLDDDAIPVRLTAGTFVVLFPQDAHAPACYDKTSQTVRKIIGKVKL